MHGVFTELGSSHHRVQDADIPLSPIPLSFEQAANGASRFVLLALLAPLLAALLTPFWLIGSQLIVDPTARAVVADRPMIAMELGLGLAVLAWMFGWPLFHLARTALLRRRITIENNLIRAEQTGLFGTRAWAEPLADYAGVTHRVRTSHSGVHHDLVLVHRRPSRSVLLLSQAKISQDTVDSVARHFGLAEIPSKEAARLMRIHGFFRLAEPEPQLAAAQL